MGSKKRRKRARLTCERAASAVRLSVSVDITGEGECSAGAVPLLVALLRPVPVLLVPVGLPLRAPPRR